MKTRDLEPISAKMRPGLQNTTSNANATHFNNTGTRYTCVEDAEAAQAAAWGEIEAEAQGDAAIAESKGESEEIAVEMEITDVDDG